MKSKEYLSDIRRNAGEKGRENRKAWREHLVFLAADFLAFQFLHHPELFKDGAMTYDAYVKKTEMHKGLAEAILKALRKDEDRITTPNAYSKVIFDGASKRRVPIPHAELPKTIKAPKDLKPESVRDLFKDWRSYLNAEFAARVTLRQAPSGESEVFEADESELRAAERIDRLFKLG